jgi:dissimilatory sulfite reductase (desulfoviridin) alpha/beta subunit
VMAFYVAGIKRVLDLYKKKLRRSHRKQIKSAYAQIGYEKYCELVERRSKGGNIKSRVRYFLHVFMPYIIFSLVLYYSCRKNKFCS